MVVTVTGSTGTIGSELVFLLSIAGVPTRAVFRNRDRVQGLPDVVYMQADLRDDGVLAPILAGTSRLFLLSGNEKGFGELQIRVIRAAEESGVAHVVKLSALGASDHSRSWLLREHWEVERALERSAMAWTILRPHAFMQNWLDDLATTVRASGVIESPVADGRVPFIDTRDIAEVAVETLLHPETHAGRKYALTGGEAVGYADLAEVLSEVTGRSIAYRPVTMDQARGRMAARGVSPEQVDAQLAIAAYQRAGDGTSRVSGDVTRILGRPPRTIRNFVTDYAYRFRDGVPARHLRLI
jgi:uncharacterized protein YbjT (DUF2867 family)